MADFIVERIIKRDEFVQENSKEEALEQINVKPPVEWELCDTNVLEVGDRYKVVLIAKRCEIFKDMTRSEVEDCISNISGFNWWLESCDISLKDE